MSDEPHPKPARLLELAKQRENAAEAARAKQAREFAQAAEKVKDTWPMHLELITLQAKETRAKFLALQKEGFTEAEALELCWRRL